MSAEVHSQYSGNFPGNLRVVELRNYICLIKNLFYVLFQLDSQKSRFSMVLSFCFKPHWFVHDLFCWLADSWINHDLNPISLCYEMACTQIDTNAHKYFHLVLKLLVLLFFSGFVKVNDFLRFYKVPSNFIFMYAHFLPYERTHQLLIMVPPHLHYDQCFFYKW